MGPVNTQDNPITTIFGIGLATITAGIVAVMLFVEAFEWYDFSDNQYIAVTGMIGALWAIVIPLAMAARGIAYAPSTVEEIKTELAAAPAVDPQTAQALAQ
jgi:hypothetical protein